MYSLALSQLQRLYNLGRDVKRIDRLVFEGRVFLTRESSGKLYSQWSIFPELWALNLPHTTQ
jgi:hypothetical protein